MATHILVNPDVITSTTFEKAFLDVSGEPLNADVKFTVYGIGAPSAKIATVPMNAQNFATSPELFDMSAKKTALIIAQTTDPIDAVHRRAAPAARADQGGADDPVVEHHAGARVQPAARRSVGRRQPVHRQPEPVGRDRSTCSTATAPRPWCRR